MVNRDLVRNCLPQDAIACFYGSLGTRLGRWTVMRFAVSVSLYVPVKHSARENTIESNGRQRWTSVNANASAPCGFSPGPRLLQCMLSPGP